MNPELKVMPPDFIYDDLIPNHEIFDFYLDDTLIYTTIPVITDNISGRVMFYSVEKNEKRKRRL